ncbi:efflux RND transporter periplasmic adaptor subunit [Roseimaritima sediminicola]|uniref:efflux RND transporter periplasmic adaptor subunit n=1 Tax=Roseimaritima sediminicola TaxID=2662066 RepID=UPI0013870648|nr:efflux RND transporter periplasmic adaptor subunit [Roseimaritima sediminicola]
MSFVLLLGSPGMVASAQSGGPSVHRVDPADTAVVSLPPAQWQASGIRIEPARRESLERILRLTGKVALNQDRVAHIYSMVEGTVDDVSARLGQTVKANDLLVLVHSREVGSAKLELYQARLQLELARTKNELQRTIAENAAELLEALRDHVDIQEIETRFRNRPMGDYRERALASYAAFLKSAADVERLEGVSQSGAVSGKTLLAAIAKRNADQATFQARLEQIQHELQTGTLMSSQAVKEAEAKVLVAATNLRILNVAAEDIAKIDPAAHGETLSHYAIRAPFDGTVLTKDVVLREQVRTDGMLLSIADLSTVWVTADVYEEHLPFLDSFKDQTITLRNAALPDRVFQAQVFYTGEIMDESTRTISLRAVADNPDHQLKPGMFVNIELPIRQAEAVVVPATAVQQHEGKDFVFVLNAKNQFQRRDVRIGPISGDSVVIHSGLQKDEQVVTAGGFVLKSQLLADLLGEE